MGDFCKRPRAGLGIGLSRTFQKKNFQPFKKETGYKYAINWHTIIQASIAQLVEHWTGKREDPGSNPASAFF